MQQLQKPHQAKILIALGMHRTAIVLATDSDWVCQEVDAIGNNCDSIGILDKEHYDYAEGVYLWEGVLRAGTIGYSGDYDDTTYSGTIRWVEGDELGELLRMKPIEPEPLEFLPYDVLPLNQPHFIRDEDVDADE